MRTHALLDTLEVIRFLGQRVQGQPHAVRELGNAAARSAISKPGKPRGVFVLAGPTGVGKTETVKALHALLYDGAPERIARFDLDGFQDGQEGFCRLFTTGGVNGRGLVVDAVVALNCAGGGILHFDELEKTPALKTVLLSMVDEGRLTDSSGAVHRLDSIFIVATTNLGGASIARQPGNTPHATLRKYVIDELEGFFSKEMVGRFVGSGAVVVFGRLPHEVQSAQCARLAATESARLHAEMPRDIGMRPLIAAAGEEVLRTLLAQGFSAELGLRPLEGVVLRLMQTAYTEFVAGWRRGDFDTVHESLSDGSAELVWMTETRPEAERSGRDVRKLVLRVGESLAGRAASALGRIEAQVLEDLGTPIPVAPLGAELLACCGDDLEGIMQAAYAFLLERFRNGELFADTVLAGGQFFAWKAVEAELFLDVVDPCEEATGSVVVAFDCDHGATVSTMLLAA